MSYIKYILCLLLLANCQVAWAADESAMRAHDMRQLEQKGPASGMEFNLSETITKRSTDAPVVTEYFGYQANPEKITSRSEALTGSDGAPVKITRRRDLDTHGLACFDTLSENGTAGRLWIDLGSQRKVQFPKCYMYKTWAITALDSSPAPQLSSRVAGL